MAEPSERERVMNLLRSELDWPDWIHSALLPAPEKAAPIVGCPRHRGAPTSLCSDPRCLAAPELAE